jgi:hypothetical protein
MTFEVSTETAQFEKPKLYRSQLTELFKANGLPPLKLTYLNRISSEGDGPPVAMVWNRRPLYDPDQALEWMRAKVQQHTEAARERARHNREIKQRTNELNKETKQRTDERLRIHGQPLTAA